METARAAAATGAKVFCAVRSPSKAEEACKDFLEPGRVELLELDTSSLASARQCAAAFLARSSRLNVLICNAGIMMTPTRQLSADGFELQFATNYLGHFQLFWLLRDAMLQSSTPEFNSRLVNVSSSGHQVSEIDFDDKMLAAEGAYSPSRAYSHGKLAQIYMANQVDRRYGARGLHATSLMPGGIRTGLQIHMPEASRQRMDTDPTTVRFMKSVEQGAATTLVAAVSKEWEGRGGRYLDNCVEAEPVSEANFAYGYRAYAFDQEKEQRLWGETLAMLGLKDEE